VTVCKIMKNPACGTFLSPELDYGIGLPIENDQLVSSYLGYIKMLEIAKQLRPNQLDVIDGGSNIGTWSIPIGYHHRDLTFHTFEVQRAIFGLQSANVTINSAWNVYPQWCGLSNSCNTIDLAQPDYSKRSNFGAFEVNQPYKNSDDDTHRVAQVEQVKMASIDSLQLKPLFIKLDLEGMEWPAIQGGSWTIAAFQPIVWAESHKSNADVIVPFFLERNYRETKFDGHWLFIPPWLENNNSIIDIIGHQ